MNNRTPSAARHLLSASVVGSLLAFAGTACTSTQEEQPIAHWRAAPTPAAEPSTLTTATSPTTETSTDATTTPGFRPPAFSNASFASTSGTKTADDGFVTEGLSPATFGEEGDDFDPSVSRDGARLVFASTQHRATSDIFVKNVAGRVVTQLTNDPGEDAMPVFSPDGSRIAFASNRQGNWDIFVMSANGGKALQLTDGLEDEVFPSWSPDGRTLVFSRQNTGTGRWEMWTIPLATAGNPSFIGYGYRPRWCPVARTGITGGDRILYQLGRERGNHSFGIWSLDISNGTVGQPSLLASSRDKAFINPEWSPDGEWIAYAQAEATTGNAAPRASELWMMHAEGEGQVRLTGGSTTSLSPTWALTDRLFFVSNRDGRNGVWSMDMASAVAASQLTMTGDTAFTAEPTESTDHEMAAVPDAEGH